MFTTLLILALLGAACAVLGRWAITEFAPMIAGQVVKLRGRATGQTAADDLARLVIAAALRDAIPSVKVRYLPNTYRVGVTSGDFDRWSIVTGVISGEIAERIAQLDGTCTSKRDEVPLRLIGRARVLLYADERASPGAPQILTSFSEPTTVARVGTGRPDAGRKSEVPTERCVSIEVQTGGLSRELHLPTGVYTVGRDPEVDVQILHPSVSRRHLELRVTNLTVGAHDLRSRNGLRLNGEDVVEASRLQDGDVLQLSDAVAVQLRTGGRKATVG